MSTRLQPTGPTGSAIFGGRCGIGARCAMLVVDLSRGFTDPDSPLGCEMDDVVEATRLLLGRARAARCPIAYTTVAYRPEDLRAAAIFLAKVPALTVLRSDSEWAKIDPRVAPRTGEPVLRKLFVSAFFGTSLMQLLREEDVDTLLITGASTSGCVRATAVDALQHGLRSLVIREAVGDRDPAAAAQALIDIDRKYGDVISLEEAVAAITTAKEPT